VFRRGQVVSLDVEVAGRLAAANAFTVSGHVIDPKGTRAALAPNGQRLLLLKVQGMTAARQPFQRLSPCVPVRS